jgi:hypothetical protein
MTYRLAFKQEERFLFDCHELLGVGESQGLAALQAQDLALQKLPWNLPQVWSLREVMARENHSGSNKAQ